MPGHPVSTTVSTKNEEEQEREKKKKEGQLKASPSLVPKHLLFHARLSETAGLFMCTMIMANVCANTW